MNIKGVKGNLRAGSQVAASLANYSHTGTEEDWQVTATAVDVDQFWLGNANLSLWLRVGKEWWVWKGVTARLEGTAITITGAGRPEMR